MRKSLDLTTENKILFLGDEYALIRIIDAAASPSIKFFADRLYITMPDKAPGALSLLLEQWYRGQARDIITRRVEHFSSKLNLSYNRIFIKGQRTRWGSCSSLKNLNFNWRLVMAPVEVIDYIVIHELSHLAEMNHSRKFWQLVESHCPDHREHRKWLREYGPGLTLASRAGAGCAIAQPR